MVFIISFSLVTGSSDVYSPTATTGSTDELSSPVLTTSPTAQASATVEQSMVFDNEQIEEEISASTAEFSETPNVDGKLLITLDFVGFLFINNSFILSHRVVVLLKSLSHHYNSNNGGILQL